MPQLVAIALVGGLVWYAWRALKREMARIGNEVAEQETKKAAREATVLEKGPDGVYRPRDPRS
jgi:hypothetical protein